MKYSIAIIVAILTLFFAGGCSENDPFPNFNLPVHSKATEIKHQNNQPAIGSKSAVYKVETAFPAEEITEFYNQKFKANGFEKFRNESDQLQAFQWNTTNPTTGNWELAKLPPAR